MLASALKIPLDAVMTLRQPDGGEPLPDDACLADYGVGAADEVELELVVAYRTEREMRAEAEENARREAEDFARLEEQAAAAAAAEAAQLAEEVQTRRHGRAELAAGDSAGHGEGRTARRTVARGDGSYRRERLRQARGTSAVFAIGATVPCTITPATRRSRRNPACGRPSSPPRRRRRRAGPGWRRPQRRRPRRWRGRISSWTSRGDAEVWTGKYMTCDEVMVIKARHTLTLQKYFRGMRARRLANELRAIRDDAVFATRRRRGGAGGGGGAKEEVRD